MITEAHFTEIVLKVLRPLELEFDLELIGSSPFRIVYSRAPVCAVVSYFPPQCDLYFGIGDSDDYDSVLEIFTLLRATECSESEIRSLGHMDVVEPDVMERLMTNAVSLLLKYGSGFCLGDSDAFERARALESE